MVVQPVMILLLIAIVMKTVVIMLTSFRIAGIVREILLPENTFDLMVSDDVQCLFMWLDEGHIQCQTKSR